MNPFFIYMVGNTISNTLLGWIILCMNLWWAIRALTDISAIFRSCSSVSFISLGILPVQISNLQVPGLGLLPTHVCDLMTFIELPERRDFSGGGLLLWIWEKKSRLMLERTEPLISCLNLVVLKNIHCKNNHLCWRALKCSHYSMGRRQILGQCT